MSFQINTISKFVDSRPCQLQDKALKKKRDQRICTESIRFLSNFCYAIMLYMCACQNHLLPGRIMRDTKYYIN